MGEQDNWEQFVHDFNCKNPPSSQALAILRDLCKNDFPKLVARDDLILRSVEDFSTGLKVVVDYLPYEVHHVYWEQYAYFLSLFLARILSVSSNRLYVTAKESDDGVHISIFLAERSKGDRVFNNEYDSELGPLAGHNPESEDYQKERLNYKKKVASPSFKPILVRVEGDPRLHLDVDNLYSNLLQDDPNHDMVKGLLEKQRLVERYTPGSRTNPFFKE